MTGLGDHQGCPAGPHEGGGLPEVPPAPAAVQEQPLPEGPELVTGPPPKAVGTGQVPGGCSALSPHCFVGRAEPGRPRATARVQAPQGSSAFQLCVGGRALRRSGRPSLGAGGVPPNSHPGWTSPNASIPSQDKPNPKACIRGLGCSPQTSVPQFPQKREGSPRSACRGLLAPHLLGGGLQ